MTQYRGQKNAFGKPGIEPRWTQGSKDGVGTAYSASSRVWFTLWNGAITEIYYPTIDWPQIRDCQYLVSDGKSFFHEEKRDLDSRVERLWQEGLGYRIINCAPEQRYTIIKEIIADPHIPCVLQHTKLEGDRDVLSQLRLYALCAPHLEVGGWGNNAHVIEVAGREILAAQKNSSWVALAASIPFSRLSCGYVGHSDGWTDLADNFQMDWEFDCALDGNVALTGELDREGCREFTLALGFGDCLHKAVTSLFQGLDVPFASHAQRYREQWQRTCCRMVALDGESTDGGNLYHSSVSLLLAHEDKSYSGALISSLSIPWGQRKGDRDRRGYHMVWTRDMVNSATGLLAAGNRETPLRALVYLAASQQPDGSFPQSFWLNGNPCQTGIQLDQVALPILLVWRLYRDNALRNFDPYPMVMRAAKYLVMCGPMTEQDRWEQASGYSPATLACNIAALIGVACMARDRGDRNTAQFLEEYADFLECHIEAWTVTTQGTLVPEIPRHYIRIHPGDIDNPIPNEDPNQGMVFVPHRPPGTPQEFPATEMVDPSFLLLVRYGIRSARDPLIEDSLQVVDEVLKADTPCGPCWHRYNHDAHGQRDDGSPWQGWGTGRAWTLLTGERGHYELAAGRDPTPYITAMENFASETGLLPEQIWDAPDLPAAHMYRGRATGSAMPLMWSHSEYIKLLRSTHDGKVFDEIPQIRDRYLGDRCGCRLLEIWKLNRQVKTVKPGYTLRIQAATGFKLRWCADNWQTQQDSPSSPTRLGIEYVDIPISHTQEHPICFTFFWTQTQQWDNRNYRVAIQ
ncbi:glycoside hydrolase family 15 protein [Phormidium sp. CCY1219]|uniref:glycoside hydrolase family 15 protein n=1 Tax=Phormidium sp. CCY1219 TaxID=2886104 RepID=UPI002D1F3E96|nr:glycoside hydrolase family 15 protein [Phormidium sp. CCY1219]MEB3829619.1 glycoside hydrolase family 15 protein [Phormidium sp. CCY1219]